MNPMMRRSFLAALGGAALSAPAMQTSMKLIKPRALKPGDTVGLITPSTYVSNPDALQLARLTVEHLGLKPKFSANVGKRAGYLAGSIDERIADLRWAFSDPEVKAVFCTRGGYGSAMLLDRIDYDLIRRNPKIFLGYSDITALHLGIHQKTGLATLHGPTPLSGLTDYTLEHLKRALFETAPLGTLANPREERPIRPKHMTRTLRAGVARGPLIGGNLTLIATTMGTPYEIQTAGRILFLEDVGEQPYSMDRMLTQLRLAGKFKDIRGLIIGECSECTPREFQPSFESTFSLPEVLDNILGGLDLPVVSGLTIGHTADQLTLPLGVEATLDAGHATITLEEAHLTE